MGRVFVQTNEAEGNRVIVFEAGEDGALTQLVSVATGGGATASRISRRRAQFC